jgi:hypothetical protein
MADGFLVRVAAVCDRIARQTAELAATARKGGMVATAAMAQSAADVLARLAFDAAKDEPVPPSRVSEEAADCSKVLRQVGRDLELMDGAEALSKQAQSAAAELSRVSRDALSRTQPIE